MTNRGTPHVAFDRARSARKVAAALAVAMVVVAGVVANPGAASARDDQSATSAVNTGSVAGHVSGQGADDVLVALVTPAARNQIVASAWVDELGDYVISDVPPGSYNVVFAPRSSVPGGATSSFEAYPGAHGYDFSELVVVADAPVVGIDASLDQRAYLRGYVRNWGGAPVPGAFVVAERDTYGVTGQLEFGAMTDNNGQFVLGPLDVSVYDLWVDRDLNGTYEGHQYDAIAGPGADSSVGTISVNWPSSSGPGFPTNVSVSAGLASARVSYGFPATDSSIDYVQIAAWPLHGGFDVAFDPGMLSARVDGLSNGVTNMVSVAFGNSSGLGWAVVRNVVPSGCDHLWFVDVAASSPFCGNIRWLVANGIAGGYADATFRPTSGVTRQAAAAFLYRAAGSPRGSNPACASAPFTDVPTSHEFCGEIAWLVESGIAAGFPDGTFRGADLVSRQAISFFLSRVSGQEDSPSCATQTFTDVPVDHPFCGQIDWMAGAGIGDGYADGSFRPGAPVSRQALAAFLSRLHAMTPFPAAPPASVVPAGSGPAVPGFDVATVSSTPPVGFGSSPTVRPSVIRVPIEH